MRTRPGGHRGDRLPRPPRSGLRAAVAAVALALTVPIAALLALTASGVPLLPATPEQVAAAVAAPSSSPRQVGEVEPPAVVAATALLDAGPGRGWAPAGPTAWSTTSVVESTCPVTSGPAPTVAGQRSFSRGRTAVTVAVMVFGAGQGGLALDVRRTRLSGCSQQAAGVAAWSLRTGSVSAIAAAVRPAGTSIPISSLTWRRGDVVLSVLAPGGSPEGLVALADAVDATATTVLRGRCVDLSAPSGAAARSPWADRSTFTGLLVRETVRITPLGLPPAPIGVVAVPLDRVVTPPAAVVLPTRPADPVWPPALPAPVGLPVPPAAPGPEPTSAVVRTSRRDPVGPGCGWAFTGQAVPTFDGVGAAAQRNAEIASARSRLLLAQQAWRSAVVGYWQASARFDLAVLAYAGYARDVDAVRVSWDAITAARAAYQQQLAAFRAAVAARDQWLADRAAAETSYNAAVAACAAAPPPAGPVTGPTGPAPAVSPPGASPPAGPAPVASPPASCPPPRPAILDQPTPPLPVPPTPPPDPRPTPAPATATSPATGR